MRYLLIFLLGLSCYGADTTAIIGNAVLGNASLGVAAAAPPGIQYFAQAATAANLGGDTVNSITPPGSMLANDLVVVVAQHNAAATLSVSEAGGQAWTSEDNQGGGGYLSQRAFWCVFDGTWDANPSFASDGGVNSFEAIMLVFRGGSGTWAVDVAETMENLTASGNDLTASEITTLTAGAVVVFGMGSLDDNTFSVQTGGWTGAPSAGLASTYNVDSALIVVYKIQSNAGGTGTLTVREEANGPDNGRAYKIAFKRT